MSESKYFLFIDVKYYEEETYIPRHNKMILHVSDLDEALENIQRKIGNNISNLHMWWAGEDSPEKACKEELSFSESEFAAFDMVKNIIENDHEYEDYLKMEEEYERSKKNR